MLPHRHQVGQDLAGMAEIRQSVDDRDAPHPGEGFHFLLVEGTDHDPVQIPGQHPGGVLHRFPPPDL